MVDIMGGSLAARSCRRIAAGIKGAAGRSLFFRRRSAGAAEDSRLAALMNRIHPAEGLLALARRSMILQWIYGYRARLCAGRVTSLLALIVPLAGMLAARLLLAQRFGAAGLVLAGLALCAVVLSGRGTIGGWLSGSLAGRRLAAPGGTAGGTVYLYLGLCGVAGGLVGWYAGGLYGVAAAAAAAVIPLLFSLPPVWFACLLAALLPLCGTSVCWALSMALVLICFFARAFGAEEGRPLDGGDLLLILFPVLCVISAVFSFTRADSAKVAVMWLGLFACVPVIRRIVSSGRRLRAVLAALALGAAVSGLYGLMQYFSGMVDTTWTDTALFEDLQLRVYSTFANPNVYGEFLLLVIPLTAGLALSLTGWKRWTLLGIDLLLLGNLVLTYSRGCYVGIALTAVVFLWNLSRKWLAVMAAAGIPLAIFLMPESVMARILSIGNMSDTSTNYRLMIYVGTLAMLAVYWLGGVGLGEKAFAAVYPFFALPGVTTMHAHSLFLQITVSFGIAGLVYLILLWTHYQRGAKRALRAASGPNRMVMLGFCAVMWGMLVQSVFDYTWYNYRVFQLFWMVLALGLAAAGIKEDGGKEDGKKTVHLS